MDDKTKKNPGALPEPGLFPHERLDVYQLSRSVGTHARKLALALPRGEGHLKDQLKRASGALPLLIAEGASRRSPGFKRQRMEEALAEVAEVAAASQQVIDHELGDIELATDLLTMSRRVGMMLSALEKKFR